MLPEEHIPPGWFEESGCRVQLGWRAIQVSGPLDFSLVGILSGISTVLAQARVSIFALSTYNTDYILLRATDLPRAVEVLKAAGHTLNQ